MIERADKTSRILDVKYFILLPSVKDVGTPYDDIHWSAVLKSVSGFEMYRKKYGRILPRNVVELLVMDREFPRAIRFCISEPMNRCMRITGTSLGFVPLPLGTAAGSLDSELNYAAVDDILSQWPARISGQVADKMNAVDNGLRVDFLARPGRNQQQQQQDGGAAA